MQHVSVHDPSIVFNSTDNYYYIFGSHRGQARTRDLQNWSHISAPWGVVDANGMAVMNPDIKQGYNEFSNVSLQEEFINMMPVIKNFDANRQLFMIQNQNLQKVISQLGSTS